MHTATLITLLLALLFTLSTASQNPCHDNKGAQGAGVTCEKVRLPPRLCRDCKLKKPGPGGNFVNCKAIYDLESPACRKQLRNYARLNSKCDPVRREQVKDFTNAANVQGLDYFVYSVCEECCDCIPRGAKVEQYANRKMKNTLFKATRGNCPAHAVYDICQIWPEVKFVAGKNTKDQFWRPKVCPLLRDWLNSPQSSGWLLKDTVAMNVRIRQFLHGFGYVARCRNKDTWTRCQELEEAQQRL